MTKAERLADYDMRLAAVAMTQRRKGQPITDAMRGALARLGLDVD